MSHKNNPFKTWLYSAPTPALAKSLKITDSSTIRQWRRGRNGPNTRTIKKLEKISGGRITQKIIKDYILTNKI